MENWIIKNLLEITGRKTVGEDIDQRLSELKNYSLKMVTFLARFSREFGTCPKIMDFINSPNLHTLRFSLEEKEKIA